MSTREHAVSRTYHHGDLRRRLLEEAILMLRDGGLEALSLRRLAERRADAGRPSCEASRGAHPPD